MARGTRRDGLKRLVLGPLMVLSMVLVLLVLVIVAVPVWFLNALWQVVSGDGFLAENSRLGYYFYWAQSNLQYVISGRGELELTP